MSKVWLPYTVWDGGWDYKMCRFAFLTDNLLYQPKNHYSLEPIFYYLSLSVMFLFVGLFFRVFLKFYFIRAVCPDLSCFFSFFKGQYCAPFSKLLSYSWYLVWGVYLYRLLSRLGSFLPTAFVGFCLFFVLFFKWYRCNNFLHNFTRWTQRIKGLSHY